MWMDVSGDRLFVSERLRQGMVCWTLYEARITTTLTYFLNMCIHTVEHNLFSYTKLLEVTSAYTAGLTCMPLTQYTLLFCPLCSTE